MRHLRWLAGLSLLVPTILLAQAQGRIKGTVTDTSGNPIAGAKVTITSPDITNFEKEFTTDQDGIFTTLVVDATRLYTFFVEANGYQPVKETHKPLIGGQTLELEFKLKTVEQVRQQQEQAALEQPGVKEMREGQELFDAGKLDEARRKYMDALKVIPDAHGAWLQIARIDYEQGKNQEALDAAEKCLAISADFPACLAVAANAAKAVGNQEKFEKYFTAYKLANPEDPAVVFSEAAKYLNDGNDAQAKPLLEKALEIDPDYPDALFQLGMVYLRAGDNAKARSLLEKFLKVAPDHSDAAVAKEMLSYL